MIKRKICKKYGYLPSKSFLDKEGYGTSISQSINKNFGGGKKVAKKLGYQYLTIRK